MATLISSSGRVILLDAADRERLAKWRWSLNGAGYAQSALGLMHRVITDAQKGEYVDHINGDPLDNRRGNLRLCKQSDNARNRRKRGATSSKYKGVSWHKGARKWQVRFTSRQTGRSIHLGYFEDEVEAAQKYDAAARAQYGQFALCNFEEA